MPFATYKRVNGTVGLIQLDDGRSNAFGHQMLHEAYECLLEAEKDLLECAGALVLVGNSKVLSSGFDLQTMMQGPDCAKNLVNAGAALMERLVLFPRPLVIGATGHAIALGAFALLTGDYRIGAATVGGKPLKVGLNETANGMNMPNFFCEGARHALAPQYLREAVALGLIFNAERAQVVGFLDEAVPQDQVVEAAVTKAGELAKWCKHPAFHNNKRLVHAPLADRVARGRKEQADGEGMKWLNPPAKL
ncbi:Enoyl-CoA delta isomerase 1, mitochondrial [Symbiodinium microadriaticum]|uniref:Enoyl-CoA delta isomerase 1, mitochondrial n=1 Tax=Symbiodinium microadriaticum TaxID=2951 RepID=A0A1Q9DWP4_SYMMI|nr:Enoyl-CoA delta isomerase 1, mitochondrial [Symbiodinium microadriaticum]